MEQSQRCDLLQKVREIWNFRKYENSNQIYGKGKINCNSNIKPLIKKYSQIATYDDVLQDIGDLLQLLGLYTDESKHIDRALFNLFDKAMIHEKNLKKCKLAQEILSCNLLISVMTGALYVDGTEFKKRTKLLFETSQEVLEIWGKQEEGKTLEIGAKLPEINIFTMKQLIDLSKRGKREECKRMCDEYGYSIGFSFFSDHIHRYKITNHEKKSWHIWFEWMKVITTYVDADDFKKCFAKECSGCMMISLFFLAYFFKDSDDLVLIRDILGNLFHNKDKNLFKMKIEYIGLTLMQIKKYREDQFLGGICIDVDYDNPLAISVRNMGNLICSKDYLKAMDENPKEVSDILNKYFPDLNDKEYEKLLKEIISLNK